MPCACNAKKSGSAKKFKVLDSSGKAVKTYTNQIEANAHAKRIGGKAVAS